MLKYLVFINLFSFFIYGIDKFLAIKHYYRISEFIILCFGFIGGVLGSILGMLVFRHKTKKIKFKIPQGIDNGQTISIRGEGEPGKKGGPKGDLYITIYVKKSDIFTRNGDNIICNIPITYTQAVLGLYDLFLYSRIVNNHDSYTTETDETAWLILIFVATPC